MSISVIRRRRFFMIQSITMLNTRWYSFNKKSRLFCKLKIQIICVMKLKLSQRECVDGEKLLNLNSLTFLHCAFTWDNYNFFLLKWNGIACLGKIGLKLHSCWVNTAVPEILNEQEDVLAHLTTQEREDITHFAMEAVRKIHYGLVILTFSSHLF